MSRSMKKHSIAIRNRRTSFSLEGEFWLALQGIAEIRQDLTLDARGLN
jgi:predicted DNA-binding ribbon-helix-helix protein